MLARKAGFSPEERRGGLVRALLSMPLSKQIQTP